MIPAAALRVSWATTGSLYSADVERSMEDDIIWYRLDILNSAPMSAFRVIAEVWPRGASGYGWAVTLPDGRKIEGESRDAIAGDEENLRRCKAAADEMIARLPLHEPFYVFVNGEKLPADQSAPLGSLAALHSLPDVRNMPLADRRAVFLDGLRALTAMTGIVTAAHDEYDGADEYNGSVMLLDASEAGDGAYECRDQWVSWERAVDAPLRAQQERNRKAHALRMKLNEMRAILAVREQHKVTRGVDGLRADIAAAEAELRTLEAT